MEEGSITEEQISAEFNEIDPNDDSGSILRTITEFSLTDTKGRIVSIEDIGNGKIGTLHGYILEPYDETWRNEILNTVITSKQQVPVSKEDFAVVLPGPTKRAKATKVQKGIILDPPIIEEDIEEKQVFLPTEELKLNREALQIGDVIDGYCTKTFHWYEAKILDIEPGPTGQLRLHFKGWASKYDEWIARDSERIAKQGSSSQLMYEAAKKASDMIPWYCQDDLIAKVSSKLSMPVPIRKRVKVTISTIDDWCIDYSYANPNLWLISTSGVWYRIAGVFCEGGHRGRPADHYKPFFTTSFERFLCATHIAMIILDFLPSNLKLSVKDVAEEVSARTKGEISEKTMLVNYKLLYDQISNLTAPVDWDKKIKISKCLFLTQLVKNGEIYQNSGGRFGLSSSYISPETADYGATEKYVERRGRKRKVPLDGDGVAITSPGGTGGGEGGNIEDWDDDDFDEPISRGPPLPETIQELPGWRAYYQGIEALDYITTDEENKSNAFMNAYLSQFKAPYDDSQYFTMMFLASKIFPPHPKPSNPTAKPFLCPTRSLGSFLHSWVTLINLKTQLGLPFVSVSFLDECLFSPLITWHRDTVTGTDTEFPIVDTTETTLRRAQKSKRGLVTGGVHPMMKEIMTALIAVLVVDEHTKRPLNTFPITVLPTESTSSGLEDTGTSVDLNRDSTGPSSGVEPESSQSDEMDVVVAVNDTDNIPSDVAGTVESKSESPDQESVTNFGDKNICLLNNTINQILATTTSTTSTATGSDSTFPASLKALHPFLSFGETWYEVLRSYIASKEKESAPELWDPLAACEEVLLMLIADPKSQPFRKPIDAQAEGLTDYHIIVTRPIDLGTILKQLRSGYYDSIDVSVDSSLSFLSTISNSADVITTSATSDIKPTTPTSKGNNHNCQFTVGDTLDFYHSQACRWYESRVTEVDFDFSPPRITLRPIRWGKGQEESVPVDSNRIAPLGHYSRYVVCINLLIFIFIFILFTFSSYLMSFCILFLFYTYLNTYRKSALRSQDWRQQIFLGVLLQARF